MMRMLGNRRTTFFLLISFLLLPVALWGATGCDLNAPDRDVPRMVPESTRYTAKYIALKPDELGRVVTRLDERFRMLYDPLDVPYTLYEIYAGNKQTGYIHGVNQKGQYGGIQVFVALDLEGKVTAFYIQKMTGVAAAKFRDAAFGKQFLGISLKDFDTYDPVTGKGSGKIARIHNPAPEMETDFYGVLRALKKNLVLMDAFVYSAKRKNS